MYPAYPNTANVAAKAPVRQYLNALVNTYLATGGFITLYSPRKWHGMRVWRSPYRRGRCGNTQTPRIR